MTTPTEKLIHLKLMIKTALGLALHSRCRLLGHRVPWGSTECARCGEVPGDELAP